MFINGRGLSSREDGRHPIQAFSGGRMNLPGDNRFEDFFADDAYVALKNHLYNYLLRKRAVGKILGPDDRGMTLEIGSGLSPMVTGSDRVVYSELSFAALRTLKARERTGFFVAADATHLPFRTAFFSHVVCSEVMEHLPDDRPAFREIAAVLRTGGSLILTFPHRRDYFACDDRFVNHYRRYELGEMRERLKEVSLEPIEIRKVLGPLEKMTMMIATSAASCIRRMGGKKETGRKRPNMAPVILPIFKWLNRLYCLPARLDNWATPRFLSAVLLVRSVKVDKT
jgi:SAM-dependent methyltransferase